MDKLTAIKIKYDDGTYSDEIPVSVLSENVEWDNTHTLVDVLGSIDVNVTGTIQDQISRLFNEKVSITQLNNYVASQLNTDVANWLNTNVNPVGSAVVVDSSLSVSGAAADAKVVGDLKRDLKSGVTNLGTHKVAQPLDKYNQPTDGADGQSLRTKGDGTTEWADVGLPTDAQTAQAVSAWLDDHPEATTTVQDGSLTINKMVIGTLAYITPEMFGAVGDGITDDHDAIQSAIDYASNNGLTLVILSKTYAIKKTLNITKRVTIVGTTSPKTWIGDKPCPTLSFVLPGTTPAIKIDYYKDSNYKDIEQVANTDHVEIKNLRIIGNNQSFCGIVARCYLSNIENLTIEGFTIGIYTRQTFKTNFKNVTTFYCDVGFFIGSKTNFNTNLIDCWCQYHNGIQNHTDASKLISDTLFEKFYKGKITGIYVYEAQCRLIRFSTEAVYYGIYASDRAKVIIDSCGVELIPSEGYGLIASGEMIPSTIICNNIVFWNNDSFTGKTAFCGYRCTLIINNANITNFGEAKQHINSCLILNSIKGNRYVPIKVTGLTGASVTDNHSKFNGDGTFTYDFVLNYTSYDPSTPIYIIGGPTLGVTGDVIVFNSNYEQLHFYSDYGTLTTTSSHRIFAYPASGTRLCFTVKYNFD